MQPGWRQYNDAMTVAARLPQAEYKRIFAAAKQAGVFVAITPEGRIEMLERGAANMNEQAEELE